MNITLVFDIGKTNKKCFLFDENFEIIEQDEIEIAEIWDEDNFPCDDLKYLSKWILSMYKRYAAKYTIEKVNFSTYGASLVHLDENLTPLTPLYNYLKKVKDGYFDKFYQKYGGKDNFSRETASPALNFLNAGLQLLWLKNEKQFLWDKWKYALHFPNYCSFLLHGQLVSEYTSIGCHTALWNYETMDYHQWVKDENLTRLLPKIVDGRTTYPHQKDAKTIIGTGLHDSSAALIPYLFGVKSPFMLISTGTWCITLNPFSTEMLTLEELQQDALQFLRISGKQVKASRLFLGKALELQLSNLNYHFDIEKPYLDDYKSILFEKDLYLKTKKENKKAFHFTSLNESDNRNVFLSSFDNFKEAYFQLMYEIVQKQVNAIYLALGNTKDIKTIFIDGGFSKNDVFCKMLAHELPQFEFKITDVAAGSALGAAIAINPERFSSDHFEKILKVKSV